ncbi:MAG: competence protein CoiA family protein [Promethearchaeota archaeon]
MQDMISMKSTHSESQSHKAMKYLLHDLLYKKNSSITSRTLEKYFGNRFADVYFKLKDDHEIVIEVQHSKIPVNEIIKRTKDYNEKGAHVLWILHGEGKCAASAKYPRDQKHVRISPAEIFLHGMYGGRVYYINISLRHKTPSISAFFALYYSKPMKKNLRKKFKTRFESYYIRDAHYVNLSNLKLLCTTFSGYKIARFYDKNVKSLLKSRITTYCQEQVKIVNKTVFNQIIKIFHKQFGKFLIFDVLLDLAKEKQVDLESMVLKKIKKKIISY